MITKRLCILYGKCFKDLEELFSYTAKERDLNLVIKPGVINHLPLDFDAYILHLSDTIEREFLNLREARPNAWIYSISGADYYKIPRTIVDASDGVYDIFDYITVRYITDQIKNFRIPEIKK
jgi:hypothetical protein